ncbi:hypothetical protein HRbin27_01501 [bacterium HR27]|nr:hypothetical protein HRbin27_01501 [bacterium HR27]
MSIGGEYDRSGRRVIGPGRRGDPGVTGRADELAGGGSRPSTVLVVLRVPAVAEERPCQTARPQCFLGRQVLFSQRTERRPIGVQDARVGDEAHAGTNGSFDHVPVLRDAPADLGTGDQKEPLDTSQRRIERRGVIVIGTPDRDTLGRELGDLLRRASECDNLARRDPLQEFRDHQPTEPSTGTSDSDHGALPSLRQNPSRQYSVEASATPGVTGRENDTGTIETDSTVS